MKLSANPCTLFIKNLFILKRTMISFIIDKVQVRGFRPILKCFCEPHFSCTYPFYFFRSQCRYADGREELQAQLSSGEIVVLDARSGKDWKSSQFKIKGALRTPTKTVDEWVNSIPTDKKLVIYCA
jgi:hypothetical protein